MVSHIIRVPVTYIVSMFAALIVGCFEPPPYPYRDHDEIAQQARTISQRLDRYIDAWFKGEVGSVIPDSLIPVGFDTSFGRTYRLVRYDDIKKSKQFLVRKACTINRDSLYHSFPDPNCTYIGDLKMILPFGHRVVIEGRFPHCRFFDIQMTPSFDPAVYHYGYGGEGEVPFADADIEPKTGHVNPFRPGADRNASKRSYRITATADTGNTWDRNAASRPPYRQVSNHRYISGIVYQGPWGDTAWTEHHNSFGHGQGRFDCGQLWIRYYLPDSGRGWNAGVALPDYWYETPDGRKYYIEKNIPRAATHINRTFAASITAPADPKSIHGSDKGWYKQFGIMLTGLEGIAIAHDVWNKSEVRALHTGITGRGEQQPKSGGTEPHKTGCTYINYLTRGMSLGHNKVAVLTGKLPHFPHTYHGADTMQASQMRYWSLTGYDNSKIMEGYAGLAVHCIRDNQLVLDGDRHYIIVLSRNDTRPANASRDNGVTWVDWGPAAEYSWTLRWMSMAPHWDFSLSPDEHLLTWEETAWSGSQFDPSLIATNSHEGTLGHYLPKVHYMTREEFETLGDNFSYADIPQWNAGNSAARTPRLNPQQGNDVTQESAYRYFNLLGRQQTPHTPPTGSQGAHSVNIRVSKFGAERKLSWGDGVK